jgi:hypothetical protein
MRGTSGFTNPRKVWMRSRRRQISWSRLRQITPRKRRLDHRGDGRCIFFEFINCAPRRFSQQPVAKGMRAARPTRPEALHSTSPHCTRMAKRFVFIILGTLPKLDVVVKLDDMSYLCARESDGGGSREKAHQVIGELRTFDGGRPAPSGLPSCCPAHGSPLSSAYSL